MSSVGSTSRMPRWVIGVRVVEAGAEGDQRTAVVPGQREPVVAERAGQGDDVRGHRPLGVRVGAALGRFVAGAVSAQVGADHGVIGARSAATCRHIRWVCGKPCSSTIGLPEPPTATFSATSVGDGDALVVEAGNGRGHDFVLS